MSATIVTFSGHVFDFTDPDNSVVVIEDIAHALSHICRFTGHVHEFYSVAQHSVHVSHLVPPEHALAGLLHDAAEAYIGDMSSPLKRMMSEYKALERKIEASVLARFGLTLPLDPSVKHADLVMLQTEKRDLMHPASEFIEWAYLKGLQPREKPIFPWDPNIARQMFIARFRELTSA